MRIVAFAFTPSKASHASPKFSGGFYVGENERGEVINPLCLKFDHEVRKARCLRKFETFECNVRSRDEMNYLVGKLRDVEENYRVGFSVTINNSDCMVRRVR